MKNGLRQKSVTGTVPSERASARGIASKQPRNARFRAKFLRQFSSSFLRAIISPFPPFTSASTQCFHTMIQEVSNFHSAIFGPLMIASGPAGRLAGWLAGLMGGELAAATSVAAVVGSKLKAVGVMMSSCGLQLVPVRQIHMKRMQKKCGVVFSREKHIGSHRLRPHSSCLLLRVVAVSIIMLIIECH